VLDSRRRTANAWSEAMATLEAHRFSRRSSWLGAAAVGLLLLGLFPDSARCQITQAQANAIRNSIGSRVEALTILGGDFGLAGGSYRFDGSNSAEIDVSKFGGAGDVGDPRKMGDSGIAWQPRLQGSMGYVDATSNLHTGLLAGGTNEFKTFAIQFGAGARFWLDDHFSLAPTLTGMFGHTSSEFTPGTTSMQANLNRANGMGLVGWNEDTWTIRPAVNIQYVFTWDRTIFTLSSDPTFFHTESFSDSDPRNIVNGNSGSLANKIDIDIPLGRHLFGRELRTGGFISRTELFGDLEDGLGTQHLYEAHGRLVLDFLNHLWKVQWIGIGGSYLWGVDASGWTVGADVAFRF
jgi:solitary outer membrane autotransporter-like beta-barrel protein